MKLIHLLVVVAFLGISASVARADGVDPIVTTKGCGGTTGTICDAVILGPGQTSATVSETFSCSGTTSDTCLAAESVINDTGASITSFELTFTGATTSGGSPLALVFSCSTAEGQLFSCQSLGNNSFLFTGASLCSGSPDTQDDIVDGVFTPDGDSDDGCGVVIGLQGVNGVDPAPTVLNGATVTAGFATPEPSSALLLLFGLMGGLVSFKLLRNTSLYSAI